MFNPVFARCYESVVDDFSRLGPSSSFEVWIDEKSITSEEESYICFRL
jgi:hypothetical protein